MLKQECLINGSWISSQSGAAISVDNPATGSNIGTVPSLAQDEVLAAIDAAYTAFRSWANTPAITRAEYLSRVASLLRSKSEELALILTSEQGKPLKESRGEIAYSANYFQWFAEESRRSRGEIIPADSPNKRIFVTREPIGVVATITPWNFPIAMLARKMAAALAAGCTVVSKPAPETPFSALYLGALCQEAGLPAGTVNIVTGGAELIGRLFMSSPVVRKVSFTGSTEVGKLLMEQSGETVKKLTLELGGNAPLLVFDDADIDRAVEGSLFGKYRNAGQTCICVNRFLVHEAIAERFTGRLTERSHALTIGDGSKGEFDIGPLIHSEAVAKVNRLIKDAYAKGGRMRTQSRPSLPGPLFVQPTVIDHVSPAMDLWNEEIFGPVCAVTTFGSDEEGIELANATPFGLAAYIYSQDLSRALTVAERLQYGMIGINDTAISCVQAPFGGVKQSGFGREGGREGIEEYQVLKYLSIG